MLNYFPSTSDLSPDQDVPIANTQPRQLGPRVPNIPQHFSKIFPRESKNRAPSFHRAPIGHRVIRPDPFIILSNWPWYGRQRCRLIYTRTFAPVLVLPGSRCPSGLHPRSGSIFSDGISGIINAPGGRMMNYRRWYPVTAPCRLRCISCVRPRKLWNVGVSLCIFERYRRKIEIYRSIATFWIKFMLYYMLFMLYFVRQTILKSYIMKTGF